MKIARIVLPTALMLLFAATAQAQIDSTSPHQAAPEPGADLLPDGLLPTTPNVYLRGACSLWGQHTENTNAMTAAFGADWDTAFYTDGAGVFNPDVCFVYMEGGDDCRNEMDAYLTANRPAIEAWVANGGSLFINAAPNQSGDINYGFGGVTMHNYLGSGRLIPSVAASNPGHPVFAGPYPTVMAFTGNWYTHGFITGPGIASILVSNDAIPGDIAFAEKGSGTGHVMFGSMTTTNWHAPNPAAQNLRANMFVHGAEQCVTEIIVAIDIKFCSDPNAFNCKKNGVLPVTIFGTDTFDVTDIDVSTLQLCTADLSACTGAPRDYSIADRGDPTTDLGAAMCAINPDTGAEEDFLTQDGYLDLDAAFEASEVQAMLGAFCAAPKGTVSGPLVVTGMTWDGTPIISVPVGNLGIDQLLKQNK